MTSVEQQLDDLLLKQLELYDEYRVLHEKVCASMKRVSLIVLLFLCFLRGGEGFFEYE